MSQHQPTRNPLGPAYAHADALTHAASALAGLLDVLSRRQHVETTPDTQRYLQDKLSAAGESLAALTTALSPHLVAAGELVYRPVDEDSSAA